MTHQNMSTLKISTSNESLRPIIGDVQSPASVMSGEGDIPLELAAAIRAHPLFVQAVQDVHSESSESFIKDILDIVQLRGFKANSIIIQQGDIGKAMYLIVNGTVSVKSGDDEMLFAELSRGAFFGEIGVLFDRERTASVVASSRVLLAIIQKSDVDIILTKHPNIAHMVKKEAENRLQQLQLAGVSHPAPRHDVLPIRRASQDLGPSQLSQETTDSLVDRKDSLPESHLQDTLGPPTKSATSSLIREFGGKRRASIAVWSDEQLMQRAKAATEQHERSLSWRNVDASSDEEADTLPDEYPRLDSGKTDATMTMAPIFGSLPEPLAVRCFNFLDAKSLCRLEATSKLMQTVLRKGDEPLQWSTLDLSGLKKTLNDGKLNEILERTSGQVRKLYLNGCWNILDDGLRIIASQCPLLEVVDLTGVWDVTDAGLEALTRCKSLRSVSLDNCRKITDTGVQSLVQSLELRSFSVSYDKNLTGNIFVWPSSFSSLETFSMQRCTGIFDDGFSKWVDAAPFALKTLILSDCSFLTDSSIAAIVFSCPNLHTLLLNFCCALTPASIETIANGSLLNLRNLDLSFDGSACTADAVKDLLMQRRTLERLSLRGCPLVTDDVVPSLLQLPSLQVLNLSSTKIARPSLDQFQKRHIHLLTTQPLLS
jgi:F-box/leucine-rich repeat protein 7